MANQGVAIQNGYLCYGAGCPDPRNDRIPVVKMTDLVDDLPRNLQYLCPVCLYTAVHSGRLVITLGDGQPKTKEGSSVAVPVTTNDDGSIAIGDVEIRWG